LLKIPILTCVARQDLPRIWVIRFLLCFNATCSGLDHGISHLRSLLVRPQYATLRSRRVFKEHKKETPDTRCLIFTCKIPANLPDTPRLPATSWMCPRACVLLHRRTNRPPLPWVIVSGRSLRRAGANDMKIRWGFPQDFLKISSTQRIAYLLAADNVSRLPSCRLSGDNQLVIRTRNRFSPPRSSLLACLGAHALAGGMSKAEACQVYKVKRTTLYDALARHHPRSY